MIIHCTELSGLWKKIHTDWEILFDRFSHIIGYGRVCGSVAALPRAGYVYVIDWINYVIIQLCNCYSRDVQIHFDSVGHLSWWCLYAHQSLILFLSNIFWLDDRKSWPLPCQLTEHAIDSDWLSKSTRLNYEISYIFVAKLFNKNYWLPATGTRNIRFAVFCLLFVLIVICIASKELKSSC
jgi:hypothetical protein